MLKMNSFMIKRTNCCIIFSMALANRLQLDLYDSIVSFVLRFLLFR